MQGTASCPINEELLNNEITSFLFRLNRILKHHIFFHVAALTLLSLEVFLFALFFAFLSQSSLIALSLATIFLTLFSYLILRVSLEGKKPQQFDWLIEDFLNRAVSDKELSKKAAACTKLSSSLLGREYHMYKLPSLFKTFDPFLEKLSCFCHWLDFHTVKEKLLMIAAKSNIELVKREPTNLEYHATLANGYILLSTLYSKPFRTENQEGDHWVPSYAKKGEFQTKFLNMAKRAMEEFKILKEFAPNDPWVHAQLAYSYRDLNMPKEEIAEYETMLKLRPDDLFTLYKLGVLYFAQNEEAKGLQVFENLKSRNPKQAERLIQHYGEIF